MINFDPLIAAANFFAAPGSISGSLCPHKIKVGTLMLDSSCAVEPARVPDIDAHQDFAVPGGPLKLGEAIHDKRRDQRFVVNVLLEALFDQGPIVDLAQHLASEAIPQDLESQRRIARLVVWETGGIHQNQRIDPVRVPHGKFPRGSAPH